MNEENKREFSWEPYVGRGALGGVIGNVIFVLLGAVYFTVRYGPGYFREALISVLILALVTGALIGLAVGFVIYKLTCRWQKQPGRAMRVAIGSICFLAFFSFQHLTKADLQSVAFDFAYAILVGGFAGLMARASDGAPLVSSAPGRA